MLFNSIPFIVFFPLVAVIYILLHHQYRWIWLLSASYFFYMWWNPLYILLIITSTIVDYTAGLRIKRADNSLRKRVWLGLSLVTNLGILFSFKYFGFFLETTNRLFSTLDVGWSFTPVELVLPIGISFYTFQTLGYTIDVYRNQIPAETHLGYFALYVAFFPQLVAGPIERAERLLPQLKRVTNFDAKRITGGLILMGWGFVQKVVIADRLGILVDQIYANPEQYGALSLSLATYFFSFQILCDFSGYTDIAIGAARVIGVDLMENFRRPYFSKNIREFWRRWHISLSTWFRDYLYIPLGGHNVPLKTWVKNILITFVLSGLWHGAGWTFLAWGLFHGLLYLATRAWENLVNQFTRVRTWISNSRLVELVQALITFHLVTVSWIFFRAHSISDAGMIFRTIGGGLLNIDSFSLLEETFQFYSLFPLGRMGLDWDQFLLALLCIAGLILIQLFQRRLDLVQHVLRAPLAVRWTIYYTTITLIILFGVFQHEEFIYFQF